MPRALSIYLPGWAIWLAQRKNPSAAPADGSSKRPDKAAWLLWSSQRGVQAVTDGCGLARAAGVRAGMTLAHARSLCAGLTVHDQPAAPSDDATALRRLARWMLRYAPVVAPDDPDGLMLDITGCEKLFGGEREHLRMIASALRRWGLAPRMALAPTFACAWAVARFGRGDIQRVAPDDVRQALSPLSVAALRVDAQVADALADVGIDRIEHLFALPRDELATRFGVELLNRLDRATGRSAETIQSIRPIRRHRASCAFDGPVKRLENVEATTRELLTRLLNKLGAAQRGISELVVEVRRVDCEPQYLSLRLTYPSRDPAHLWKLLGPRVERVHLGYGVTDIVLEASHTQRLKDEQSAFLRPGAGDASDQRAALGELIDHLVERLGRNAVTRIEPAASYMPERAFTHTAIGEVERPVSSPARFGECAVNPAHRPSLLFETPEPLRVMSLVPDGPPIWLSWQGQAGEIVASIGPERIVSPWWTKEAAAPRDYYEAEDSHGRHMWLYRDGGTGSWFVHGQWI